jgi:DegV family protein with EDD domain
MRDFKILSDGCCDIPDELLKKYDINIIPFYVSLDGKKYLKQNQEISSKEFCDWIHQNKNSFPKTSFPTSEDFTNFFKKYLDQNLDILYISLTSKFSGSFQTVMNITKKLQEEYSGANIIVVDSTSASFGEGLLVLEAAEMKNKGASIYEIRDAIEKNKNYIKIFVTVDSLLYLQKGGRIGKVSALAGSILNIKPIISMRDGELYPHSKVRGRKRAIQKILDLTLETIDNKFDDYTCGVLHLEALDEANEIINTLKNKNLKVNSQPIELSPLISSHIGPTTVGIASIKKINH